jgi:hypothetical protein
MKYRAYLSGPVTDTSLSELSNWRSDFARSLGPRWDVFDPTRGPVVTQRLSTVSNAPINPGYKEFARDMVGRNRATISNCDLLVANFLGAREISLGSVGEVFWADAYRKQILVIRESQGNRHDHLIMNELATWIVDSLPEAVAVVHASFGDRETSNA